MCDPATFLAIAGAGTKAISALGQGFANSSLDQFSAGIADINAKIAGEREGTDSAKGALDIGRTAGAVNDAVATSTSHFGARNLDPTFGSPLAIASSSILNGQGDMAIINARTSAAVASDEAAKATAIGQRSQLEMKSGQDIMSGYFGAATALLAPGMSDALKGAKWPWQGGATGKDAIVYNGTTDGTDWG